MLPTHTQRSVVFLVAGLAAAACASGRALSTHPRHEVAAWMTGAFASTAQHQASPADFFDIRLAMVPIWTERDDGPWLYVEQAIATAVDRPYRQRVYRLVDQADGSVRSDVFLLPGDPLALAGPSRAAERFATIAPEQLQPRSGCSIVLRRVDATTWAGSTDGTGCASERSGAAYATAEVTLDRDGMRTLDRGYDANGAQVWGSTKGPYHFVKQPAAR